jgi:hypothetical protein
VLVSFGGVIPLGWTTSPTIRLRKFPSCRAVQGCPLGVSTSSSTEPKPAAEDTVFPQRRDTGVTQLPIERFVIGINPVQGVSTCNDRLLDTQEVTGSSPVGPTDMILGGAEVSAKAEGVETEA